MEEIYLLLYSNSENKYKIMRAAHYSKEKIQLVQSGTDPSDNYTVIFIANEEQCQTAFNNLSDNKSLILNTLPYIRSKLMVDFKKDLTIEKSLTGEFYIAKIVLKNLQQPLLFRGESEEDAFNNMMDELDYRAK